MSVLGHANAMSSSEDSTCLIDRLFLTVPLAKCTSFSSGNFLYSLSSSSMETTRHQHLASSHISARFTQQIHSRALQISTITHPLHWRLRHKDRRQVWPSPCNIKHHVRSDIPELSGHISIHKRQEQLTLEKYNSLESYSVPARQLVPVQVTGRRPYWRSSRSQTDPYWPDEQPQIRS